MSNEANWLGLLGGPMFIVFGVLLIIAGISMLGEGYLAIVRWLIR